jgi:hypothetical protein
VVRDGKHAQGEYIAAAFERVMQALWETPAATA